MKNEQKAKIRSTIKHDDQQSFWKALNTAKCLPSKTDIPDSITWEGKDFKTIDEKVEAFRTLFKEKMISTGQVNITDQNRRDLLGNTKILDVENSQIFTLERIKKAFENTKSKPSYGHDRVPMRVLIDSLDFSLPIIISLFKKIENGSSIPDKWKVSRILPLHKKGDKRKIENYRPISNICSLAKVFERCIQLYLQELESKQGTSLTGSNQFGFKNNTAHQNSAFRFTRWQENLYNRIKLE